MVLLLSTARADLRMIAAAFLGGTRALAEQRRRGLLHCGVTTRNHHYQSVEKQKLMAFVVVVDLAVVVLAEADDDANLIWL